MSNALLFMNGNNIESQKIDERVKLFGQILNGAFQQYQKLWNDYKELLEKSKEAESRTSVAQNFAKDNNGKSCTCGAAANTVPEQKSAVLPEERKADNDSLSVGKSQTTSPFIQDCDQHYEVFSQDFYTQGLEESFLNQSKTPLQEIQNVNPERSKSPVFGSKKAKLRIISSPINSQNVSQESVVVLKDFGNETTPPSTLKKSSDSDANTTKTKTCSITSPITLSSPTPEVGVKHVSKNVTKLGISTVRNVQTDIIIGSNKKLKQSKLFLKTEKVTDLSYCDDVFDDKSKDQASKISSDSACFEESLIQGSPEYNKRGSKVRQKVTRRIKSVPTLKKIVDIDSADTTNFTATKTNESMKNDVDETDTDLTVFDPKLASTQYSHLPSDSKINDETLFTENLIPSSNVLQQSWSFDNHVKKRKLSLKRGSTGFKPPPEKSKSKGESELDVQTNFDLAITEESKEQSPPRKKEKFIKSNFDVPSKKRSASPTYAYKGSPVRKKAERALLNGWSCLECQQYYEDMGLSEEELQNRKNKCSRHRSKFNEKKMTQKDFWEPDFPSSYHSTMWCDD